MGSVTKVEALKALNCARKSLLGLPNVHSVGIGERTVKGRGAGYYSIKVIVDKKRSVSRADAPPEFVEIPSGDTRIHIRTDIYEAPREYSAFTIAGGSEIESLGQGRMAVAYRLPSSDTAVGLTCHHVISDWSQRNFAQEVSIGRDAIGTTRRILPIDTSRGLNRFDVALFEINAPAPVQPLKIRDLPEELTGYGNFKTPTSGSFFYFADDEVEVTAPPIWITEPTLVRKGKNRAFFHKFWLLETYPYRTRPGHSGSLVVKRSRSGPRACGLVFAGHESSGRFLVSPIRSTLWNLGSRDASPKSVAEDTGMF